MKVYQLIQELMKADAGAEVSFSVNCGSVLFYPIYSEEFFIDIERGENVDTTVVFDIKGYPPVGIKKPVRKPKSKAKKK